MARDFHELVRERMNREPEFAAGLYQDCINLLQSDDDEDRAVAEETLANYFDHEQTRAAHQLAAKGTETTEPAAATAD